jgi:hypothetical protein
MTEDVERIEEGDPAAETSEVAVEPPSENPYEETFDVQLSVPRIIKIEMVEARSLGDYELWLTISSVLLSAVVGFFVAWLPADSAHDPEAPALFASLCLFVVFFIGSVFVTVLKRRALRSARRSITYRMMRHGGKGV